MLVNFKVGNLTEVKCDALIINLFEDIDGIHLSGATGAVDNALGSIIKEEVLKLDKYKGKLGKIAVLPTYGKIPARKVVIVGLGKRDEFDLNAIRKASAEAIKRCKTLKAEHVCSVLHGAGKGGLNTLKCAQVLTEGALLGNYNFEKYKSKKGEEDNSKTEIKELSIIEIDSSKQEDIQNGIKKGEIIATATNFSRDLVCEAPSVMTPSKLADTALSIGIECRVFNQPEIEKMGMTSFLGVARGSAEPPKFIHMIYRPEETPVKKVAVVGKGITFDSGGLDLKTAAGMLEMKMDMSGAAAVLGVMKVLKSLAPNIEVHGIIPACENMPDGKSYKPGDILTAKNGKTIEVNNTDAEGRLILADALCYAVEQKPDEIIDLATLTGAVIIALGKCCSAVMGNNQELIDKFMSRTRLSGEKYWQLPLFEEYKKFLKSDIADITNSGAREAGSSFGGVFLQEFVEKIPWIHLDIAGAAWYDKPSFEVPKGPTGFGVRSVVYYLLND